MTERSLYPRYFLTALALVGFSFFCIPQALHAQTAAPVVPAITVTPSSRDFGKVAVGSSADQTFTVQNTGSGTLTGTATVNAPFSIVSGGTYTLSGGQSQTVTVRLSPTQAGTFNSPISFTGGSGATASVSGTAILPANLPIISVTPSNRYFGSIAVSATADQTFTVQNTGSGTLSGTATATAPFSIVSGGSYSLTAGQSQTVIVRFSPTQAGTFTSTITFTGGSGATASVLGLATTALNLPLILVSPSSLDFGSVKAQSSADQTVTVQNGGSGAGTLSGTATANPPFSIVSGGNYALTPGQSQTVTVRFSPAQAGTFSDSINFTGGAGVTVTVTGIGVGNATQVSVAAVSVSPSTTTAGQTATGTVTLSAAAPSGGSVVNLSSSDTHVTVPATVTVAAGATTATFNITTTATPALTGSLTVTITVAVGNSSANGTLNLTSSSTSQTGTWASRASMPTARYRVAAGVVNSILYAVGGQNDTPALATNEAYDPSLDKWFTKAPMPTPRSDPGVGVIDDVLYAAGGFSPSFPGYNTNIVEAYHPGSDSWVTVAPMPTPRHVFAAGVVNGVLYAIGGYNDSVNLSVVEAYNPITNTWQTKAPMPTPRSHIAAGVINGKIYVIGGWDGTPQALSTVEVYDPSTDTWAKKAPLPTPRWGLAVGVVDSTLYAVGGTNGTSNVADVEAYNPATDTWTSVAPIPTPRVLLAAGVVNNVIYAVGGSDGRNVDGTNQAFTPTPTASAPTASFTWSPATASANQQVQFTDASTGSPTSWSWNFGDGGTSTAENPTHPYTSAGTYSVSLTVANTAGSNTVTRSITVSGASAVTGPVANFTWNPTSPSPDQPIQFTDTSSGSPTSWEWNFGDGLFGTSSQQNPKHTYSNAGTYPVSLTVTNGVGANTVTKLVTVSATTAGLVANFTWIPALPIPNQPVQFSDASSGSPVSWSWNFGEGGTSAEQAPSHTYSSPGSYSVSLTVTNASGTNTVTKSIPVSAATPVSITDRGGVTLATSGAAATASAGYASLQPSSGGTTPSGLAIFGFRQNGVLVTEAAVPASPLIQSGRIYAEVRGPVDTGLAIVNPNNESATVSFYFTDSSGKDFGNGSTTIPAFGKVTGFLDGPPFNGGSSLTGAFTFNSSIPVSAVAIRGFTNERSEFLMTTLPVTDLSTAGGTSTAPFPGSSTGASTATIQFPDFADGGGWATEIILINPGDTLLTGTVQFRDSKGIPAPVSINGQSGSSFPYSIPARTSQILQTSGTAAATASGSVLVTPAVNTTLPSGLAIFSFSNGGITVTQAGIPASPAGNAFRLYAEASGTLAQAGSVQTGFAVMNMSSSAATVSLELSKLDGTSTGLTGSLSVPANGQVATFLNAIQAFASLATPFQGILRVSSTAPIAVVGLRGRYNERNDFLITATPAANEALPALTVPVYFPHIVDGGGYTTQFIIFSGQAGQTSSGSLQFFTQDGAPMNLNFRNGVQPSPSTNTTIGTMGGQLRTAGGDQLTIAAGTFSSNSTLNLQSVSQDDAEHELAFHFADQGLTFVRALQLNGSGVTFAKPGQLSIVNSTGIPDSEQLIVAQIVPDLNGDGFPDLALTDVGLVHGSQIDTYSAAPFTGVRSSGTFVFLRFESPIAFVTGQITNADATPASGTAITSFQIPAIFAETDGAGDYVVSVASGPPTPTVPSLEPPPRITRKTAPGVPLNATLTARNPALSQFGLVDVTALPNSEPEPFALLEQQNIKLGPKADFIQTYLQKECLNPDREELLKRQELINDIIEKIKEQLESLDLITVPFVLDPTSATPLTRGNPSVTLHATLPNVMQNINAIQAAMNASTTTNAEWRGIGVDRSITVADFQIGELSVLPEVTSDDPNIATVSPPKVAPDGTLTVTVQAVADGQTQVSGKLSLLRFGFTIKYKVTAQANPYECDPVLSVKVDDKLAAKVQLTNKIVQLGPTPIRVSNFSIRLAVTKQGSGQGSVTSVPPGIDCGPNCQGMDHLFPAANTSVTLTALASPGSNFAGWDGACANETTNACVLSLDSDKGVIAKFSLIRLKLTVTKAGAGLGDVTSVPPGITAGCVSPCVASFDYNQQVVLTASPATGSLFAGWSNACNYTSTSCTITMDGDKAVTATFILTNAILIQGHINSSTLGPLGGASITVTTGSIPLATTSAADGSYTLSIPLTVRAQTPQITVKVSASGHVPKTVLVDLSKGDASHFILLDVTLDAAQPSTYVGTFTSLAFPSYTEPNTGCVFTSLISGTITLTLTTNGDGTVTGNANVSSIVNSNPSFTESNGSACTSGSSSPTMDGPVSGTDQGLTGNLTNHASDRPYTMTFSATRSGDTVTASFTISHSFQVTYNGNVTGTFPESVSTSRIVLNRQ